MRFYIVVNSKSDDFYFYDEELNIVSKRRIGEGCGPRRMVVCGDSLYIACAYSGTLIKHDIRQNTFFERQCGRYLTGVAGITGADKLAAVCGETNSIMLIDALTLEPERRAECPEYPVSLAEKNGALTVACITTGKTVVFDQELEKKAEYDLGRYIYSAKMDSAANLYCACADGNAGEIIKLDRDGKKVLSYATSVMPTTLCLSQNEKILAVAQTGGGGVLLIDTCTGKRIAEVETISMPDDIVSLKHTWLMTDMASERLLLVDHAGKILRTQRTGQEPRGIAVMVT